MTLPEFWTMISGKQIIWDERARGRDKLAQRWVQRLRFSDTHLGRANANGRQRRVGNRAYDWRIWHNS
jgi:hypothetical protein